jgi:hypothetical protein
MADFKCSAFAPNSVAHRGAQVIGEYLPRELAHITGEYLRVVHEWDAETGWKSLQLSVSADRKTATVASSRILSYVYAVGRYTFGEGAPDRFTVAAAWMNVPIVGLIKRSGPPPDWSSTGKLPAELSLRTLLMGSSDELYVSTRTEHEGDRVSLLKPIARAETVTYTFVVDRVRKSVDLLINGEAVLKEPIWTDVQDIDEFAPLAGEVSTNKPSDLTLVEVP